MLTFDTIRDSIVVVSQLTLGRIEFAQQVTPFSALQIHISYAVGLIKALDKALVFVVDGRKVLVQFVIVRIEFI